MVRVSELHAKKLKWKSLKDFKIVEFRRIVACEDQSTELRCGPHTRIAIYSASFGRTEYESIKCPQPQGVPEESDMSRELRHGDSHAAVPREEKMRATRKRSNVRQSVQRSVADVPQSHLYMRTLKGVSRKVLVQVLQEREEDEGEEGDDEDEDEEEAGGGNGDYDENYGGGTDDLFRESSAFSPAPNADGDSGFGGGPGKAQPSLVGKSAPGGGGPTPRQHSETNNTSSVYDACASKCLFATIMHRASPLGHRLAMSKRQQHIPLRIPGPRWVLGGPALRVGGPLLLGPPQRGHEEEKDIRRRVLFILRPLTVALRRRRRGPRTPRADDHSAQRVPLFQGGDDDGDRHRHRPHGGVAREALHRCRGQGRDRHHLRGHPPSASSCPGASNPHGGGAGVVLRPPAERWKRPRGTIPVRRGGRSWRKQPVLLLVN
ncbi:hypothetical protein J437_LFUL016584, partial [Ladona fulva]